MEGAQAEEYGKSSLGDCWPHNGIRSRYHRAPPRIGELAAREDRPFCRRGTREIGFAVDGHFSWIAVGLPFVEHIALHWNLQVWTP